MDCTHLINRFECDICLHGADHDPWGVNHRLNYADHIYDGVEAATVAAGTNPAPSEALYQAALDDQFMLWADSDAYDCPWCNEALAEYGSEPDERLWEDHKRTHNDTISRTTQFLPSVGRPNWVRTEFHRDSFLGFYRNELTAMVGFGFDPEFTSIHEEVIKG